MRVLKTRGFERFAKSEGITDAQLVAAIKAAERGLIDADLGGGIIKLRIARPGKGKSGGFRTLVATNKGGKWFFVFGFPKNVRSNIDKDEEEGLKKLASHLLSLSPPELVTAQRAGELMEVNCDAQDQIGNS